MTATLELAAQWVNKALNDLLNADNNLAAQYMPADTVCFHCQQAAEKLLKGYLVGQSQPYPFTHDLLLLLERVRLLDETIEALRDDLILLQPYSVEIRYPDDGFMPNAHDAEDAREAADKVLQWFKVALPAVLEVAPPERNFLWEKYLTL